jgi:hypothetical protein
MWPQVALVAPFACSNLRRALGALPQQTSVYVPRRLGPVTGAWRRMPSARAASRIAACRGETCPRCRPGCRAEASLPRPACPPPRSPGDPALRVRSAGSAALCGGGSAAFDVLHVSFIK